MRWNGSVRTAMFGNVDQWCSMQARLIVILALWVFTSVGCASQPAKTLPQAEIYERGSTEFKEAWFFKPAEDRTEELTFRLAPLLLLEVATGTDRAAGRNGFGVLPGTYQADPSRPVICVHADTVQVRGEHHIRMTYLWSYPLQNGADTVPSAGLQGVRITLNAASQPAIWEVLADSSQAQLVFVAKSVEAAAAAEFGPPLEGRRYAVEAAITQAPKTVVARVIDDGPTLMGPMIYLRQQTGDVMTLVCRCMNSQAKALVGMGTYKLQQWPHVAPRPERAAFWPFDLAERRLDNCLRVPAKF